MGKTTMVAVGVAALLALAAAVGPAVAAPPRIVVTSPARPTVQIGDYYDTWVQLTGTPPLTCRWSMQEGTGAEWKKYLDPQVLSGRGDGGPYKCGAEDIARCPGPDGRGRRLRVVVSNREGEVRSAPLGPRLTLPAPTIGGRPREEKLDEALARGLRWYGDTRSAAWPPIMRVYRRAAGSTTPALIPSDLSNPNKGLPAGSRFVVASFVVSQADDGATYWATSTSACPGVASLTPRTVKSTETVLRVNPRGLRSVLGPAPLCPRWTRAAVADLEGFPLNDGRATRLATCGACVAACSRMVGCNTWVWGAGGGGRDGQCWLKHWKWQFPGLKAPSSPSTVWASGSVSAPKVTCEGSFGSDYGGELLNDGHTFKVRDCAACAAACRDLDGCNVWVFGVVGFRSVRHRECWLKRVPAGERPPSKDGPQWVSGVIR